MNYARPQSYEVTRDSATDQLWVTYRWMTLGLAATGVVALAVASSPALIGAILGNRLLLIVLLIAQVGLVATLSAMALRVGTGVAATMFFAYAALTGVTFSTIFLVYTAASIAATFFVTAGAFAGLSAVGFFTKRDLSAVGRFAIFALVGLILASVVNLFLHSSGLQWLVSIAGIFIFAGLTAYDTQRLKRIFESGASNANLPIVGALTLYLDFINMFLMLLRFFGNRRSD